MLQNSPCIDAGINDSVQVETDINGNNRIMDGNNDNDSIVDMGAYESDGLWNNIQASNKQSEKIMIYPNPCNGRPLAPRYWFTSR